MSRSDRTARWALNLSLVCAVVGCGAEGSGDTRRTLLETWSTGLIVPLYADFEARSEALASSLDALCAAPAQPALDAARTSWSEARVPLKRAEVFNFGPYSRPEFRIGPEIDSWPARTDTVEELLASTEPVDPARLAVAGVYRKGMPVIEYLLYPPEADPVAQLADARRCEYLESVGAELVARAHELHMAWAPEGGDFAGQLSGAGRTSTAFRSLRDAFGEIVNRMGFTVENIRRDKLGAPLGAATGGRPQPEVAESRFSGRSIADILDNLSGIELLYFGDSARSLPGLATYAAERGRNFDEQMTSGLAASREALAAIDMPLTAAVMTEAERVQAASDRLGELQSLLQVDVIGALGLTLSFNDNDGD
jgi:predicted lipoprotein